MIAQEGRSPQKATIVWSMGFPPFGPEEAIGGAMTQRVPRGMVASGGKAFPHVPPQPVEGAGLDRGPGRAIVKD